MTEKNTHDSIPEKQPGNELREKEFNIQAQKVASSILDLVDLKKNHFVIDFGTGNGVLGWQLSPYIGYLMGIDNNPNKIQEFKNRQWPCEIGTSSTLFLPNEFNGRFDGLVSSMAMHHIRDIDGHLSKAAQLLKKGGFASIYDLDSEDGSFHSSRHEHIPHTGFDRQWLQEKLSDAGFHTLQIKTCQPIIKTIESGETKSFSTFLTVGYKK